LQLLRNAGIYSILDLDVDGDSIDEITDGLLAHDDIGLDRRFLWQSVTCIAATREQEFRRSIRDIQGVVEVPDAAVAPAPVGSAAVLPTCASSSSASPRELQLAPHGRRYKRGAPSLDAVALPRRRFTAAATVPTPPSTVYTDPGEALRAARAADLLWQGFLNAGSAGAAWEEDFVDEGKLDERRDIQISTWLELPLSSLQQHTAALARWVAYCETHTISIVAPTLTQVACYIKEVRTRGDTVPLMEYSELGWLQRELGLRLHHGAPLIEKQTVVAPSREPAVKVAPKIKIILALEELSQHACWFAALVAAIGVLLWTSAIRFCHLQRSRIVNMCAWYIEGSSTRGKPRTKGRRKPFTWTASRHGINGTDYTKVIDRAQSVLRDAIADDPSFHQYLLPDFDPPNCPIAKVTALKTKKMSTKRFLVYVTEMLTGPPVRYRSGRAKSADGTRLQARSCFHRRAHHVRATRTCEAGLVEWP